MRIIGAADEFWRLRMTRVDVAEGLDFEWHEDILYREPATEAPDLVPTWRVEAVLLDDIDTVVCLATFEDRAEAEAYHRAALEDLAELTKSRFEETYFSAAEPGDDEQGASGLAPAE